VLAALNIDPGLVVGGLVGGFTMGLTGMGGGALLTPMLVLLFNVSPAAAVGSDLVTSLIAKPVGGAVHLRHGTVRLDLVKWLAVGSMPGAFGGVLLLHAVGDSADDLVKYALGSILLVAAVMMVLRNRIMGKVPAEELAPSPARPLPTALLGLFGGVVVGMTSVGSGSLMIAVMAMLYPRLSRPSLVGTDLLQAIPLVASAAVAHLLFGHVELDVTASLVLGSIPGIYVGARLSARTDGKLVRMAIPVLLLASSAKLLSII
jgi:uncharacterized membrane protein YfcA